MKAAFNAGMVSGEPKEGLKGEKEGLKGEAALRYVEEKFPSKQRSGEREISRPNAYGGMDDVPVIDDPLGGEKEAEDA